MNSVHIAKSMHIFYIIQQNSLNIAKNEKHPLYLYTFLGWKL